jgi:predicted amidohydrolase YtcJ
MKGGACAPDLLLFGATLLDARRASLVAKDGKRRSGKGKAIPAEAVLVRGDRIAAIGPLRVIRGMAGRGVRRIDLGGGTLTPGFTDSHIHLVTWLRALGEPRLAGQEPEAIGAAVRARLASAPEEEWLILRGWISREWPAPLKVADTLQALAPDRPLVLYAVDGHSAWANRVALERAGIGPDTPDPPGGRLEREPDGTLTGVLVEEAHRLIAHAIQRRATASEELEAAIAKARSLGITGAHDFDRSATWRAASELEREGRLRFRLLLSVPVDSLPAAEKLGLGAGLGGAYLRVGPVKMFADGTLGSATALLEEPYEGSENRGFEILSPAEMVSACGRAAEAGLSVAIHAIGDGAVRRALDAIEAVSLRGAPFPLPPRIEHVQLSRKEDWTRFRSLGVLASVQPVHQVSDRALANRLWGGRTARSYAWRGLAQAGATMIFGSDAPFDRAGPLLAIQSALLRRESGDPSEWAFHPEQRLGLGMALRCHLENPHRAAGWPRRLGRLEPGWGADLAHFDLDLLANPVTEWHRASALVTWIDGEEARAGSRKR